MSVPFYIIGLDTKVYVGDVLRVHFKYPNYAFVIRPTESSILGQLAKDVSDHFNPTQVVYDTGLLDITQETGYVEGKVAVSGITANDIAFDITDSFNNSTGITVGSMQITSVEKQSTNPVTQATDWFKQLATLDYKTTAGMVGIGILLIALVLLIKQARDLIPT